MYLNISLVYMDAHKCMQFMDMYCCENYWVILC